jgi:hypothetical protein
MAITFPRSDIFTSANFVTQSFRILQRQEISRQANGVSRGKDLGTGIWTASWTTAIQTHEEAVNFEAIINSLDGVVNGFYAGDLRREYPLLDPTGSVLGSSAVKIHTVSSAVSWRLKGLPVGYVISRGDYMSYDYGSPSVRALVQAMESATADAFGVTPEFVVRSELRAGTVPDLNVTLKKPTAMFRLIPDGFDPRMDSLLHGSSTFSAMQAL